MTAGRADDRASGFQQQLAGDVTALKTAVHLGGLGQREYALDGHLQPAGGSAGQYVIDALLPFRQRMIDMAKMQAGKSLRTRQDALADVLERLALGLSDAGDMAELLDDVAGAV